MKKLYEEAYIETIASTIRNLVPDLYKYQFSTANMPEGIRRVYEEGKTVGKVEGHKEGKLLGFTEGYSKGHSIALKSIPRAEGVWF